MPWVCLAMRKSAGRASLGHGGASPERIGLARRESRAAGHTQNSQFGFEGGLNSKRRGGERKQVGPQTCPSGQIRGLAHTLHCRGA